MEKRILAGFRNQCLKRRVGSIPTEGTIFRIAIDLSDLIYIVEVRKMRRCLQCDTLTENFKFCSPKCCGIYYSIIYKERRFGKIIAKSSICLQCKNIFTYKDYEKRSEKRFCNTHCSSTYSSSIGRKETNKKISLKLKGRPATSSSFKKGFDSRRVTLTKEIRDKAIETKRFLREKRIQTLSYEELKSSEKLSFIKFEQSNKCDICRLDTWNKISLTLELHHKDGNKLNNTRENLQFLCPNCHSQTKTYCRKKSSL